MHANRERWRPEFVLDGTPREHEVTPIDTSMQVIEEYRKGAKMSLIHTGRVLGYLFPKVKHGM